MILIVAVVILPGGCNEADEGTDGTDDAGVSESVIEVTGVDGTKSYNLDELKDMPVTEGYWGMKSSTGRITPPVMTKGVSFADLFAEVGGLPDDMAVGIVAKDGYEMTASVAQIKSGEFITYDMVTGEENSVDGPLTAIVAYEWDGQPFDPQVDGPLRMAIVSPEQNQVTDGHWSVKWTTKLLLKDIEQEWTLALRGKLAEDFDRATFESGAAEGCHGTDWTDAEGNTWTGIPLYLRVGRVDDEIAHEGPAYNRELAEAGYQVDVKAADGTSVEIASTTMYYNKELIVAYKLNGEVLPEEYWPLRLVGEGIDDADMIGQITEIEALVPTE
jgi:DMSO/TMAO reductase YedYZ molybdopterin-dependent catalytic subunit